MLQVKTTINQSKISGIGLYAAETISKNTIIWKFTPGIDLRLDTQDYTEFKKTHNFELLDRYIYKSKMSGMYILCSDDARFINHSSQPNTIDLDGDMEGITMAARDIQPGEEITSDYCMFDMDFSVYAHMLVG